jgi:tetratricopeptide (TPR) repeat protein
MSQAIEELRPLAAPETDDFVRLRRLLIRARGFALALVECNVPVERDRFVERLRATLAADGVDLVELRLTEAINDLYDELASLSLSGGQAVAVLGLEHSIPARSYFPPVLDRLNLKRELFRDLPGPVVLFLPEYALTQLAREAPDFWAWRTAVFEIEETKEPLPVVQYTPTEHDLFGYANLSADRKHAHLEVLRSLLTDLEQREGTEAERSDLHIRISYILRMLGDLAGSYRAATEAIDLARAAEDETLRMRALDRVADVLKLRGHLDEALRMLKEESLPVHERLGDVRGRALALGQIADIYQFRGDLDEALQIRQEEELPVYVALDDMRPRAVTLGKIADIYESRGDLDEALRIRQEELLPVFKKQSDPHSLADTLSKIADVHQIRGDLDEALRIRQEESLPIYEELGDARSSAITLGHIAGIYQSRGDLDEALRIFQEETLPVYEKLGDLRSKAVTLAWVASIHQQRGEADLALRILKTDVLPVYECLGLGELLVRGRIQVSNLLLARKQAGDQDQARHLLCQSLSDAERMRIPEANLIRGILKFHGLHCGKAK